MMHIVSVHCLYNVCYMFYPAKKNGIPMKTMGIPFSMVCVSL